MIESETQTAERIASEMSTASELIDRAASTTISLADGTTLTVNDEAQTIHAEMINLTTLFNQVFQQTVENLQSVEATFTETDKKLDRNFDQLLNYSVK